MTSVEQFQSFPSRAHVPPDGKADRLQHTSDYVTAMSNTLQQLLNVFKIKFKLPLLGSTAPCDRVPACAFTAHAPWPPPRCQQAVATQGVVWCSGPLSRLRTSSFLGSPSSLVVSPQPPVCFLHGTSLYVITLEFFYSSARLPISRVPLPARVWWPRRGPPSPAALRRNPVSVVSQCGRD